MELIYVGNLLSSKASYKKIIEKYDKDINKRNFMKHLFAEILITLFGK